LRFVQLSGHHKVEHRAVPWFGG